MKTIINILALALFSISCLAETSQTAHTDTLSGAISWETKVDGVHFSLKQILPEQVQAFYVNRGFTLNQIETYAQSCVYMTVLRNDSAPVAIHSIRNNWSVVIDGKPHTLIPVDQWVDRLARDGIKKSALIAFRWAQFPPEQEYEPGGDWNQGMLSVGLPPGSTFDVTARWDGDDKMYEAALKGVQCAK